MKQSTKIALWCGGCAAVCIAGAVYCKKRNQTRGAVACGALGGCALAAAAGCTAYTLREKRRPRPGRGGTGGITRFDKSQLMTKGGERPAKASRQVAASDARQPCVGRQTENTQHTNKASGEGTKEKTNGYLYLLCRNGAGEDKTLSQLGLLEKIKDAVQNNQEVTREAAVPSTGGSSAR